MSVKRRDIVIENSKHKHFAVTQKRSGKKIGVWKFWPQEKVFWDTNSKTSKKTLSKIELKLLPSLICVQRRY